jgi:16S rRNA processing protein RimM
MTHSRICVAQLGAPHGVRGEMRLRSFTQVPEDFAKYGPLELETPGKMMKLISARAQRDVFLVKLEGVADRDAAALLTNQKLYVSRDQLPDLDEEEEYYHADLIGLSIVMEGAVIGTIVAVPNFGAGDLLEMKLDGQATTHYLPFLKIFVPHVDLKAGRVIITPPHNFFDEPDDESGAS